MALGESYMDGWWDCDALDRFFDRILNFRLDRQVRRSLRAWRCGLSAEASCSPDRFRAFTIGKRHYDIGNDLFRLMLDTWMNLICRKLKLEPGMRLLDIGCGWQDSAAKGCRYASS
jgi:cyclopropane-fatty-acyl-phospholipid synthase